MIKNRFFSVAILYIFMISRLIEFPIREQRERETSREIDRMLRYLKIVDMYEKKLISSRGEFQNLPNNNNHNNERCIHFLYV